MSHLLSREAIVAPPGFNRWLVPPAALAIHLSIGMAYGFSVFWLPLSRAIGITTLGAGRLEDQHARLDVHAVLRDARLLGGAVRRVGRARGTAQGRRRRGVLLGRRLLHFGARHLCPPGVAAVARLGRDRRLRSRARLHLAGLDADQVVSRSARDGDRAGDHGLRRRRDDRHAAGRRPDATVRDADIGRRLADVRRLRRALLHRDDGRRVRLSAAAAGMDSRRAGRRPDAQLGRRRRCRWTSPGGRGSSGCSGRCSA